MPGCVSRIERRPARTSGWSSAISTETGIARQYPHGMMRGARGGVTIAGMKRLDWGVAAAVYPVGVGVSGLPSLDRSRCGIAIPAGLLIVYMGGARHDRRAGPARVGPVPARVVGPA